MDKDIDLGSYKIFEYSAFMVKCQPPFLAVTIFRLPKQCPSDFLTDFDYMLALIHTNYRCILVGDFNLHVDNKADTKAMEF